MRDEEKVAWLASLLVIWGMPLLATTITLVGSDFQAGAQHLSPPLAIATGGTIMYLLILFLRLAYIAGQRNR